MKAFIKSTAIVLSFSASAGYAGMVGDHAATMHMLLQMDLNSLFEVDIVSATKTEQKLSESAAAVFVITQEDIRRNGAQSVPELLRMVPGVQVARVNSSAYAITIRGFNSGFSNKLLVMVDGRTMYTSEFSGVYWEMLDLPLEDIERIEVVRGPGGALWGANAVNGVINIITKRAEDTQGNLLVARAGFKEQALLHLRHGGQINERVSYRVYAKGARRDDFEPQSEVVPILDHWKNQQAGFRLDGVTEGGDEFTLQGGLMKALIGEDQWDYYAAHVDTTNRHLLGRWTQHTGDTSQWSLQAYYDYKRRADESLMTLENSTLDLEFQHQFEQGAHAVLWGAGYRRLNMDTPYTTFFYFAPQQTGENLYNLFAQDTISLSERLKLTLGSKFEKHYYTGWELQPSARLLWTPNGEDETASKNTYWAAVSRAVRTPSRYEHDSYSERPGFPEENVVYEPYPFQVERRGAVNLDSETVVAYELGHRYRAGDDFSVDTALFYNDYRNLVLLVENLEFDEQTGYTEVTQMDNQMRGRAYGLELAANWVISPQWRLAGAYTWSKLSMRVPDGVPSAYDDAAETRTPRHQLSLRSHLQFAGNWEFDSALRYVSELPELDVGDFETYHADSYLTLDLRLGWHPTQNLELSLVGRDLLDSGRDEFAGEPLVLYFRNRVERSVFAQLKWAF